MSVRVMRMLATVALVVDIVVHVMTVTMMEVVVVGNVAMAVMVMVVVEMSVVVNIVMHVVVVAVHIVSSVVIVVVGDVMVSIMMVVVMHQVRHVQLRRSCSSGRGSGSKMGQSVVRVRRMTVAVSADKGVWMNA